MRSRPRRAPAAQQEPPPAAAGRRASSRPSAVSPSGMPPPHPGQRPARTGPRRQEVGPADGPEVARHTSNRDGDSARGAASGSGSRSTLTAVRRRAAAPVPPGHTGAVGDAGTHGRVSRAEAGPGSGGGVPPSAAARGSRAATSRHASAPATCHRLASSIRPTIRPGGQHAAATEVRTRSPTREARVHRQEAQPGRRELSPSRMA